MEISDSTIEEIRRGREMREKEEKLSDCFMDELRALINRHSIQCASGTPDWILAEYLSGCLEAFECAVNCRDQWIR